LDKQIDEQAERAHQEIFNQQALESEIDNYNNNNDIERGNNEEEEIIRNMDKELLSFIDNYKFSGEGYIHIKRVFYTVKDTGDIAIFDTMIKSNEKLIYTLSNYYRNLYRNEPNRIIRRYAEESKENNEGFILYILYPSFEEARNRLQEVIKYYKERIEKPEL